MEDLFFSSAEHYRKQFYKEIKQHTYHSLQWFHFHIKASKIQHDLAAFAYVVAVNYFRTIVKWYNTNCTITLEMK